MAGIMIGGVDPVQAIVDLEVRVAVLERLLELSINRHPIDATVIQQARQMALDKVKAKYPQLGIT